MTSSEFEKEIKDLELRIKSQRKETLDYKLKNRNLFYKLFNIQPDMSFCDMCLNQDRIFTTKMLIEKLNNPTP